MSFLNRVKKVIGDLVDNTDPLNPIVSLDILPDSTSSTTCEDSVLVKSGIPTLLNGNYVGWSAPETVQWSNILVWDNRSWKVFFDNLETNGLWSISTTPVVSAFTSFQLLIDEINNQLLTYGSSFRVIGHQDGNRILVCDTNFNPLLDGDPYFATHSFNNMSLIIEDSVAGSDWLIKATNPKAINLNNIEFISDTGYVFKKLQCICDQLQDINSGTYDVNDSFIAVGSSSTLNVQGWIYDGVNTGNGYMQVPFVSNNSVSINALQVDGVDYIPGGIITNTYLIFQDFIDVVNGLILSSGVQLATNSNNYFYVAGSNGSPIPQSLSFDFYDNTAGGWFTKGWAPNTINITSNGECKRVKLPLESQDWKLQGNAGTNPLTDFLGTTDLNPLFFETNNVKRGCFTRNGNFVVGVTEALIEQMDSSGFGFNGISTINTTHNIFNFSSTGGAFGWQGIAIGGTPTAPTLPVANALMGATNGQVFDGLSTFRTVARMRYHCVGAPTATSMPTKITFSTTPVGSITTSERMVINEAGNIGIGVLTPLEKLDVFGNVKFSGALMPNNLPGTLGQVLTSAGAGVAPTWTAIPVTNITSSNGLTTLSNNTKLGGAIIEPTVLSGLTATNKLSITGTGVDAINLLGNSLSVDGTNKRIGIGTNAPSVDLDVTKASNGAVEVLVNNTNIAASDYADVVALNGDIRTSLGAYKAGGYGYTGTESNHDFFIYAGGITSVVVKPTGRIGIGLTSAVNNPTDTLYIGKVGGSGLTFQNLTSASTPISTAGAIGVTASGEVVRVQSVNTSIRTVIASTTLLSTDYTVVFNGASLTATLPTPSNGVIYNIKNINSTLLSITGNIDGTAQTIVLSQFQSRTFHSDGATWFLI